LLTETSKGCVILNTVDVKHFIRHPLLVVPQ